MSNVIKITDRAELVPTKDYKYGHWPFEFFNPVQSKLTELFKENANVAVASSTASGKTICSEIFAAYSIREQKGKMLYVGPLKALAKEKEQDWKSPTHHFSDLKISICTGDYKITQARIKELDNADIILMTPEMLASRTRNHKSEKSNFLKNVKVLVVDEAHIMGVPSRGDHIEVAMMKLVDVNPDVKIVFLSATMPNVGEICEWLSKLTKRPTYFLESGYRPCPLGIHYETYYDYQPSYDDKELAKVNKAVSIIQHYPDDKFLVFAHTKKTGNLMVKHLEKAGINSEFHSADLDLNSRLELERKFREDKDFRIIVATSTLAWGINAPARRAIILGVDRGLSKVELYDIWQMVGRAGRPKFDPRGDAYILVPQSKKDEMIAWLREKPPIMSQLLEENHLGNYKTLAFHIVSEIHHGNVRTKEGFHDWFKRSLASFQNHDFDDVLIDKVIDLLIKHRAIKVENDEYVTTPVGAVASMFYFSPFDVADLKNNFNHLFKTDKDSDLMLAACLANVDSNKMVIANKQEKIEMAKMAKQLEALQLPFKMTDGSTKIALAYYNLINGIDNPILISTQTNVRYDSERVIEVLTALDSMSAKWGQGDYFKDLKLRLTYGVRSELIDLCRIPNIGKVKAERLFANNIKTMSDLLHADPVKTKTILGMSPERFKQTIETVQNMYLLEMTN